MIKMGQNKSESYKFKERQNCCLLDSVSQNRIPKLPNAVLICCLLSFWLSPIYWRFPGGILTDFNIANCRKLTAFPSSFSDIIAFPLPQIRDKISVQVNISDRSLYSHGAFKIQLKGKKKNKKRTKCKMPCLYKELEAHTICGCGVLGSMFMHLNDFSPKYLLTDIHSSQLRNSGWEIRAIYWFVRSSQQLASSNDQRFSEV